jgi:stalled ribosome alternative rescue factor ArfA
MSVQASPAAEASQKLTVPCCIGLPEPMTVAVNVITLPAVTVVTADPPEVTANVVTVTVASAHACCMPPKRANSASRAVKALVSLVFEIVWKQRVSRQEKGKGRTRSIYTEFSEWEESDCNVAGTAQQIVKVSYNSTVNGNKSSRRKLYLRGDFRVLAGKFRHFYAAQNKKKLVTGSPYKH